MISRDIKSLLAREGKRQKDLIEILKVTSPQAVNNKFARGSWSGSELVKIAEYCGCELAFVSDTNKIVIKDE